MFTQIKNFLVLLMVITIAFPSACKTKYPPLRIGNSIGIKDMNYERLKAMKECRYRLHRNYNRWIHIHEETQNRCRNYGVVDSYQISSRLCRY